MTITEIPNMPGLSNGDGYFERGYDTGDATFPRARVRFTPRQTDPGVAGAMNISAAPIVVCVAMSVSLVDTAGQVIHVVPDRGLVFDARSHTWQGDTSTAFDPAAWILDNVATDVASALNWAKGITAAAALGLIAAVPAPVAPIVFPPPSTVITVAEYQALFSPAELTAIEASDDQQVQDGIAALRVVDTVDLTSAVVLDGFDHMVDLGLITTDSAARKKLGQPPVAS